MRRSALRAVVAAEKDELVWPLGSGLFAFDREGPDDTLEVGRLGNDNNLRVGPGGVIQNVDAIREGLSGSRPWKPLGAGCTRRALGLAGWGVILVKRQLPSSEDQGSPRAASHCCRITGNAPWYLLVFCTNTEQICGTDDISSISACKAATFSKSWSQSVPQS